MDQSEVLDFIRERLCEENNLRTLSKRTEIQYMRLWRLANGLTEDPLFSTIGPLMKEYKISLRKPK
jgi:hypothetical protein